MSPGFINIRKHFLWGLYSEGVLYSRFHGIHTRADSDENSCKISVSKKKTKQQDLDKHIFNLLCTRKSTLGQKQCSGALITNIVNSRVVDIVDG